jgi:hypothetical protein
VPLEEIARTQQAARALFDASREGRVVLIGSLIEGGDESDPLPPAYFDTPRRLASENAIETDLDRVSMEAFVSATTGRHTPWFSVRVDGQSFRKWIAPPPESLNQRKRRAVSAALESLDLRPSGPLSKTLTEDIIELVKGDQGLTVTSRYVREIRAERKHGRK